MFEVKEILITGGWHDAELFQFCMKNQKKIYYFDVTLSVLVWLTIQCTQCFEQNAGLCFSVT